MSLGVGTRLGPYEVLGPIGAGGMGEVYRARDTKLDRQVAIKVLPDVFVADPERVARLQREARTLASLNHQNIAAIHGLEEVTPSGPGSSPVTALVLEYVDGPTLADRIAGGPIPWDEALPIAKQLADALRAAHDQGVVHRDSKPANIKVRGDGAVKVLDFGLAKAVEQASNSDPHLLAQLSQSPTITSPFWDGQRGPTMTSAGVILGTAAYMSPEQARGRSVDKRTDIWAFGCVLFEMLSGQRPFSGEDVSETLASVIKGSIDWTALPATTPSAVRRLIEGCLQRDRALRIGDISTAHYVLTDTVASSMADGQGQQRSSPSTRWVWVAVAVTGAVIGGLGVWGVLRSPVRPASDVVRFPVTTAAQPIQVSGIDRHVAISPDGQRVAFVSGGGIPKLWVRSLDAIDPVLVVDGGNPRVPFFSPDDEWVGYYSNDTGELLKVSAAGGQAFALGHPGAVPRGAMFTADDSVIFGANAQDVGLQRIPASGGERQVLTRPDRSKGELNHVFPAPLPNGDILFTTWKGSPEKSEVTALDVKSLRQKTLVHGGTHAQYLPTGHLVYASASAIHAVRFDLQRLEVIGQPTPVVGPVFVSATTGTAGFSVSSTGTLVYVGTAGTETRTLLWVDRAGREEPIVTPPHRFNLARVSPDGTRLALDTRDAENADIWIWTFDRGLLTRLTSATAADWYPVWAPDGRQVIFSSTRDGRSMAFRQSADTPGNAERLASTNEAGFPDSLTPDGRHLLFSRGGDLHALTLTDSPGTATALFQTPFTEANAEVSRDGRWIAYQSDESGRAEVYVRSFPDVNGVRVQISSAGGTRPAWSRDGRELFFVDGSRVLMSASIKTSPTFAVSATTRVLDMSPYWLGQDPGRSYDVSLDGKRFLIIKDTTDPLSRPSAIAVLNWFEELKRLVPVD